MVALGPPSVRTHHGWTLAASHLFQHVECWFIADPVCARAHAAG
jgi:hypothetical protein